MPADVDPSAHLVTARRFGLVFGTGLAALGVVGFAVTGFADPLRDHGAAVLGFGVNPAGNVLHMAAGVALTLGAAWGDTQARHAALVAAGAFLVLAGFGYVLVGTDDNALGVNRPTSTLHLLTGLAAVLSARTRRGPASPCHHGSEPPVKT